MFTHVLCVKKMFEPPKRVLIFQVKIRFLNLLRPTF